jgi:hypothetical protein
MMTVDAEVVIGSENDNMHTVGALLQHFLSLDEVPPTEPCLYYVYGRVACMDTDIVVSEGFERDDYKFLIDADVVCVCPCFCSS